MLWGSFGSCVCVEVRVRGAWRVARRGCLSVEAVAGELVREESEGRDDVWGNSTWRGAARGHIFAGARLELEQ